MSSPAEKLLADLSGAFGEEAVRAAVMGFQGSGGSMTPSMVTKSMAAVMASYKNLLLQILSSCYGPWDCQFARDVLLGVEFEFERSGIAEAMLPFVSDLDNFERIVIKEGCPGLANYAISNIMEQVRAEEARRHGVTAVGAASTGGTTINEAADGSTVFVPPMINSSLTGTANATSAQTEEYVVQSAVPVQNTMNQNLSSTAPVLTPVASASPYSSFNGQTQMPQATATVAPVPMSQVSVVGQQQHQQICVQIPYNSRAGQVLQARTPSGQAFAVRVPPNTPPGSTIMVVVPQPNTQNLIQPARTNEAAGSGASGNAVRRERLDVLARRLAENRRRRKVIQAISAIVFFVIVGQIIGVIVRGHLNYEDDGVTSNYVTIGRNETRPNCSSWGYIHISSEDECLEAANDVTEWETVKPIIFSESSSVHPRNCYYDIFNKAYRYNTHISDSNSLKCSSLSYTCICKFS